MITSRRLPRLGVAGALLAVLMLGLVLAPPAWAETFVNRWTQVQIGVQNGQPVAVQGAGANWVIEPAEDGFVRLKDAASGGYLNVEKGLAVGPIQPGWWSAMWTLEQTGDGFVRIRNRWKREWLNVERGPLVSSGARPGWWSAMWQVVPAPGGASATQTRAFPETYKSPAAPADAAIAALSPTERACFDSVPGKVAWNRAGSTDWGTGSNILALCEGTQYPEIRVRCFQSEVQRTDDWKLAITACKNAEAGLQPARIEVDGLTFLSCVDQRQRDEQIDFMAATEECKAEFTTAADDPSKAAVGVLPALGGLEQACADQVQGKIASDPSGSTQWQESSLRTLCAGTPNPEWTVSCLRQELARDGDSLRAVTACKASTQATLGIVIPPRALKSPAGVDAGALCSQVLKCALDTAHSFAPASICGSCGSGAMSVADALRRAVEAPDFGNGCAAALEVKWLKDTITGGFNSAVGLLVCTIAPATQSLDRLCNGTCSQNCAQYAFSGDQRQYQTCQLQCGCGWDKPICEQGTKAFADVACKALGLLK